MQNSLNKERNIVEFASKTTSELKGATVPNELSSQVPKFNMQQDIQKVAQVTPIKTKSVFVIKKDGTSEPFDNSKIIKAVTKSATRALVNLTEGDLKEICNFVDNNIIKMNKEEKTFLNLIYGVDTKTEDTIDAIEELLGEELGRPGYHFYGAPAIILCANKKGARNAMADCSAALQNMMLAAHVLGLGTCWINQFRDVWGNTKVEAYLAQLGLPEGYEVQCSTIVGYPAQSPVAPARKPGTVTYVK